MRSVWIVAVVLATAVTDLPAQLALANGGSPAVSPDGLHIAFLSNRGGGEDDVFVIASDGSHETQLTRTPEEEGSVQWTADGKEVVFARFAGGTSRIFAVGLDGKNEHQIGTVPGRSPIFSPDGKQLVYMAGDSWTTTKLIVSAADGAQAHPINDGTSIAWNNHWSPDGKRIAFTGRNSDTNLAIYVMNSDGSSRRQVTHLAKVEGHAQWPTWSPDGHYLAFQVNKLEDKTSTIWTVELATGEARKLSPQADRYLDETPSWFPDGKRIAFQSNRTGTMEVWEMNAEGSAPHRLTGH